MLKDRFDPVRLDPAVQAFLNDMAEEGGASLRDTPIAETRALFVTLASQLEAPTDELDSVTDLQAGDIPIRRYVPGSAQSKGGALVFLHGGGWVLGDLETHDALCRRIAHHSGVQVFAVDYRLAPEHRFPAGLEDCISAFSWVRQQAELFDIDPARIAVGGDSAGGNLSAVLANELAASGQAPAFQLLIYPVTQLAGSTLSLEYLSEGYFLSADDMGFFADQYLDDPHLALCSRISPLLQDDLSAAPPALVLTAGFDPLCDEGMAYAEKLRQAGVPVDEVHAKSMVHGFCNFTAVSPSALSVVEDMARRLGKALRA